MYARFFSCNNKPANPISTCYNFSSNEYSLDLVMLKILMTILSIILFWLTTGCTALLPYFSDTYLQSGSVLFQDEFNDPGSGWPSDAMVPIGSIGYDQGKYGILVAQPEQILFATPGLEFTDVLMDVHITKVAGSFNDQFGIICRYQDNNNFYFMVISSDGYYGIGKILNGMQTLISSTNLLPSEVIQQGYATNHLQGECKSATLSLSVNGVYLVHVTDDTFTHGDIGLIAGTFQSGGNYVNFDNFSVIKP